MGRAAASRAEIDIGTLEELEFHWGSAYHVAVVDGVCTARRRDGKGGTLTDPLPEGLRLRIVADYHADPVPRDPAATSRQPDVSGTEEDRALGALRLAWDDAYDIGCEHGRWTAVSRDAGHRTLAGESPAALNAEIRSDFAREGTL
jgi:hypothetical protein